ncbi:MAG: App1 family protein [Emticicia sp.]|uniref:App1 family protein n=1 Tax=Emticicia sp. TaxID=1930953 RepID=UPI003BA6B6FF
MKNKVENRVVTVKVYHGYGHQNNLVVYGHVLAGKSATSSKFSNNLLSNIIHLIKLFLVKPIPKVKVILQWQKQLFETITEADGFFKFEWKSDTKIEAGWHPVIVHLVENQGFAPTFGEGKLFVPHATQYGFISDIDDTVLVSHSANTGKKLRVMFTKHPRSRKTFADVVKFYKLLSLAHTSSDLLNPFFYVSSSEWNLYDDLNEFFKHNGLPKGAFLLNNIKKWYELLKTGKTKHEGKLIRVTRILKAFPKQRFILLGDNSQSDPQIYTSIANKYPEQIVAVYIRNISLEKENITTETLDSIQNKSIEICQFKHTDAAIRHAQKIGLLI